VATIAATGRVREKTKTSQLKLYAWPGYAKKVMLLTKVPSMESPTAQLGSLPSAIMNPEEVLLFLRK